jgi:hypothetical protein
MERRIHRRSLERAVARADGDGGFASVSYVFGTAVSLLFFVTAVNLLLTWYGTGAIREAIDEGARAGAIEDGDLNDCQVAAQRVLDGLLGGAWGDDITVECSDDGDVVTAQASGVLPGFVDLFGVTDFDVSDAAIIIKEPRLIEELDDLNEENGALGVR